MYVDIETVRQRVVDPRTAVPTQFGWLDEGEETAQWSRCDHTLLDRIDGSTTLTGHNIAGFDWPILFRHGSRYPREFHDSMLMASVLGYQDLSLKGLSQELFGIQTVGYEQAEEGDPNYLAQDLFLTRRLATTLDAQIEGTAYDIDRSLIPMLTEASYRGYEIDQEKVRARVTAAEAARDRAAAMCQPLLPPRMCGDCRDGQRPWHCLVGHLMSKAGVCRGQHRSEGVGEWILCKTCAGTGQLAVSMGSYEQLQEALGVETTGAEFLKELVNRGGPLSEPAQWILLYREHADLLTKYLYKMQKRERFTGLFNLSPNEEGEDGTTAGRLSSRIENMQNLDPRAYSCLRAPEGYLLLTWDLSQIELRWAAEASDSEYLIEAFRNGRDLHQETTDLLGLPDRQAGKRWNFATLYGAEEYRLSTITGKSTSWCADALGRFRVGPWRDFFEWGDRHWATVQRSSYSVSPEPFLHRRYIPLLNAKHAKKAAVNHPIQCGAVYTTKAAMYELDKSLPLFVNQVHDAAHYYVPDTVDPDLTKRDVYETLREIGQKYLPRVGIDATVSLGKYWEAK